MNTTIATTTAHPDAAGPGWRSYSTRDLQRAATAPTAAPAPVPATGRRSPSIEDLTAPRPGPLVRVRAANAGAGASTIALALADVIDGQGLRARLLDAAAPQWSGLVGASVTELGTTDGWRRGRRGREMLIDRVAVPVGSPGLVPAPREAAGIDLTVLDTGWTDRELATSAADTNCCWVTSAPAIVEVLVTRSDPLALRQTEAVLAALAELPVVVAMVGDAIRARTRVGRRIGRGTRPQLADAGPRLLGLHRQHHVVYVPLMSARSMTGLGPGPLPRQLLRAADRLLEHITIITRPLAAHPATRGDTAPC